jgi:hypothetical protein
MLRDLDLSVTALLSRWLPAGTAIRFDPPAPSWAQAPPDAPMLDAFAYDIREVAEPPAAEAMLARDQEGRPAGWQLPVRKYRVSYLLTEWTAAEGRHELLGAVLVGCATAGAIPADCLHGVLAEGAVPVPLICAAADRISGPADLWPSLGVPARTALDLMVVAPVVPRLDTDLAPAVGSLELSAARMPEPQAAEGQRERGRRHITE